MLKVIKDYFGMDSNCTTEQEKEAEKNLKTAYLYKITQKFGPEIKKKVQARLQFCTDFYRNSGKYYHPDEE